MYSKSEPQPSSGIQNRSNLASLFMLWIWAVEPAVLFDWNAKRSWRFETSVIWKNHGHFTVNFGHALPNH